MNLKKVSIITGSTIVAFEAPCQAMDERRYLRRQVFMKGSFSVRGGVVHLLNAPPPSGRLRTVSFDFSPEEEEQRVAEAAAFERQEAAQEARRQEVAAQEAAQEARQAEEVDQEQEKEIEDSMQKNKF